MHVMEDGLEAGLLLLFIKSASDPCYRYPKSPVTNPANESGGEGGGGWGLVTEHLGEGTRTVYTVGVTLTTFLGLFKEGGQLKK